MNEPWMTNYRGLAVVPATEGDADAGYAARYKIVQTQADGTLDTLAAAECEGRFATTEAAVEAANDAGRVAVDRLLDGIAGCD